MERDRIREFLASLERESCGQLSELRASAEASGIPIIRKETEDFMRTLLCILRPKRILEIGAAIGYSSIMMASCTDAAILTVESYESRARMAQHNIEKAGLSDRIELRIQDAGELLRGLSGSYDFIFLDAAKGQYINWLPDILRLMDRGSVLMADNVLQDLTVMESRYTVTRRDRTTHSRMREFLYAIKHEDSLESTILDLGDGISISVAV